jgi:hypothetical protein
VPRNSSVCINGLTNKVVVRLIGKFSVILEYPVEANELINDCKKVNILASCCIVTTHYAGCAPDRRTKANEMLQDVSTKLGKKKVSFLAKPRDLWMLGVVDGAEYHVEVVIKVLHDPSSLIQDLSKLLDDKKVTDVKIVCNGETFKCHKAILAARSDVFAAMFEMSGSTEETTGEVKIKDIDAKTMKSFLMYMYQNRVLKQDADMNLLFAADKYNIADLVLLCEESIMSNISDETVLDIAMSSRLLASQEVFEAAKEFIESRPIKSLKSILAARSDVFTDMFQMSGSTERYWRG